ncbi:MAG: argininosuccinate lyase [Chloroflexi bacterium]|nr:argininosuccinate lyase [Anaerolineaceae bacterium]NMB90103.1 argininosuccinate lyase [Chloroflexota bacterium]
MKLWQKRFRAPLDPLVEQLNNSISFDQRLAKVDVTGSIAWAGALAKAGVLTPDEGQAIQTGLGQILGEFEGNEFQFLPGDEDIHTAVERRLGEVIGPLAGKLHTGRSRNDQVATDFRLWLAEMAQSLTGDVHALQAALVERAERDAGIVLPGMTHFQQAQPVLLSHWWLSHFWPLGRDGERIAQLSQRAMVMPLGCGALAGTSYPVDRFDLAQQLGFRAPAPNSLDAVSDRDFAAEFLFTAALLGVHLSRLAEALILYSTREFGWMTLADEYSTGSSLMPQKKNPDPLELVRGKSGVLTGRLAGLLATLKGLPSAYDKDLQEDKPAVFEAADTISICLKVMAGLVATLHVHGERMRAAIQSEGLATDLADYLVMKGVPFREAHGAVGAAVALTMERDQPLAELPLADWQAIHPAFDADLYQVFDVDASLARRAAWGGTAPQAVQEQLALAHRALEASEQVD